MRLPKLFRLKSVAILLVSILITFQLHISSLPPANSETVVAVVALVKAVSASGLARGVCFTGAHMGANECRKPSRCVEGIERVENIVKTNGSSESVRQLETWIGSASQNKNCAISLSRHLTGNVNLVDLSRSAVAELNRLRDPKITSLTKSFVKLRNKNWGRCLNLQSATKNGVPTNGWDCVSHPDQEWKIETAG